MSPVTKLGKISQSGIKSLLRERLENPERYNCIPLIIWRSDYEDGIQERILSEVFNEYNSGKDRKEQKWYICTKLGEGFSRDDFRDETVIVGEPRDVSYGRYDVGMYVIDPMWAVSDYKSNPDSLGQYHDVLNVRRYGEHEMRPNIPAVAFMLHNDDWFETPEAYPDAEQYVFEPDFEEFENWAIVNNKLPQCMLDFIKGDGDKKGIMYRFYNCFSYSPRVAFGAGCAYPRKWLDAWTHLQYELEDEAADKLCELSERDFSLAIGGTCISEDIIKSFREYVLEHNV